MIARLYAVLLPIGPIRLTPLVCYSRSGACYCAWTAAPC